MAPRKTPQKGRVKAEPPADLWTFAQPDWEKRLRNRQMPVDLSKLRPHLNHARVERAGAILDRLVLPDVPGQPTLDTAMGPWFREISEVIAGSLLDDGRARITDVLIEVAKKNSKTSYSAALMLALMLMSPRPRASFVLVGPTLEIAQLAFQQISGMVHASPELSSILHVREHIRTIEHRKSGCTLASKSFDVRIATGSRPAAILLDESWLLKGADAARIIGQLRGGQASIEEGIMITISTQSDVAAAGYWRTELQKARAVRDGEITLPGYLPILYEPPRDIAADKEKLSDPKTWAMCNPNLDKSVSMDWLKRSYAEAVASGDDEVRRWLSQHTNAETTTYAAGENAWGGAEVWADHGSPDNMTFDQIINECSACYFGFDGGGGDDITSLSVIGQFEGSEEWHCATRGWVWPVALERRKSIAGQLQDYVSQGDLNIVQPGEDLIQIGQIIETSLDNDNFIGVGVDPAGIATDLANHLSDVCGVDRDRIIAVRQGYFLRAGWLAMERRLRQGQMFHPAQPMLDWMVSNTLQDASTGLVTKKIAGVGKIDGIMAMASAAMVVLDGPPPPLPSDLTFMVM
jgi:phage terminase large subunit-like protein